MNLFVRWDQSGNQIKGLEMQSHESQVKNCVCVPLSKTYLGIPTLAVMLRQWFPGESQYVLVCSYTVVYLLLS